MEADWHKDLILDQFSKQAIPFSKIPEHGESAGLVNIKTEFYRLGRELESQISCSFPIEGVADKMRKIFSEDIGINKTGFEPEKINEQIIIYYPHKIIVGEKQ